MSIRSILILCICSDFLSPWFQGTVLKRILPAGGVVWLCSSTSIQQLFIVCAYMPLSTKDATVEQTRQEAPALMESYIFVGRKTEKQI